MFTSVRNIGFMVLLVCALAVPAKSGAEETNADPKTKHSQAPDHIPFHGKLKAIDKEAKTISVGEQTIHITDSTKTNKGLDEAVMGDEVSGAYKKSDAGMLEAVSVRFGAKPKKE